MRTFVSLALCALSSWAQAQPVKVATWNLGWHLDKELAAQWRASCSAPFELNPQTGRWQAAERGTAETKKGWELPWGRNAPIEWNIGKLPPCNVWEVQRQAVPVELAADTQRRERLQSVLSQVSADVWAFQEVSGTAAVQQLLGPDYRVCSYSGHKVQRLALAWRKSLGEGSCDVEWPLALLDRPEAEQLRPGLALTLNMNGKRWRFLTVHLKSSCVSPLDGLGASSRGQLEGDDPACQALQAQVAPIESWVEKSAQGMDALVWMGDFNRNLAHEDAEPLNRPVRSDSSDATQPLVPPARSRNLWREVNDERPSGMPRLTLLEVHCDEPACLLARREAISREAYGQVRNTLGCRNPLGLDHIVVSAGLRAPEGAHKVSLGAWGRTEVKPGETAVLALSDHCPLTAVLTGP